MLRLTIALGFALIVAVGCAPQGKESRRVGSIFNPYCMPDGSVVRIQYSNSGGSYEGTRGDPKHCSWNKE